MGWNNDYTILTGPINLADIGRAAGYPSGQSGDNVFDGGWLFVNGLFNIWAKHKGFKSSSPGYAYDKNQATPELRSPARIAAALAANWGMNIPDIPYSDINSMVAGMALNDWTWDRPTQGAPNERFRPMDFDGYTVLAQSPLYPLQSITDLVSSESTMSAGIGFGRNIATQFGFLTLDDLHINGHSISDNFGEWYFGICLYYSNTVRYAATMPDKYKTIGASLSEIGLSVPGVSVPNSGSRTYRAIPFFASIPFNSMPSSYVGSMYPLPFAECQLRITRTQDPYIGVIMYTLMGETNKLYYQYKIINPTNTQRTYTVNVWALRSYNINDTYGNAVRSDTGVIVPAQGSYTLPLQTITDGITIQNILSNAAFVGAEMLVGVRVGYSISSIIIDADPTDPPTL